MEQITHNHLHKLLQDEGLEDDYIVRKFCEKVYFPFEARGRIVFPFMLELVITRVYLAGNIEIIFAPKEQQIRVIDVFRISLYDFIDQAAKQTPDMNEAYVKMLTMINQK